VDAGGTAGARDRDAHGGPDGGCSGPPAGGGWGGGAPRGGGPPGGGRGPPGPPGGGPRGRAGGPRCRSGGGCHHPPARPPCREPFKDAPARLYGVAVDGDVDAFLDGREAAHTPGACAGVSGSAACREVAARVERARGGPSGAPSTMTTIRREQPMPETEKRYT